MDTTNESASHDGDGGVNTNTTESASRDEGGDDDAHHPFECYICYNPATQPVLTKCGHLYCWPCLYKWARTAETCAVCRAKVNQFNVICLQTPWSKEEESAAKADEIDSGIPPRPQPSPPAFHKVVFPILEAINRDGDQKDDESQDRVDAEQLATTYRKRWEFIGDLVYSMQLQYEMIQPREQNGNALPPVLDARLIKDCTEFEAGRGVPDAQRPHVIMMKERVEAILRRRDDERQQRVSDNFDIVQSEQSAQSHAQEEDSTASSQHAEISQRYGHEEEEEEETASSQHQEIAQRHGQEEEEETASSRHQEIAQRHGQEEEEGASYRQEEATYRRGEEQVEMPQITMFNQQLARIRSALQAAGLDLQLDFGAMEGEQIAERSEEVGDAASSTDLESSRQG
jgi:hypothetical protein